MVKTKKLYLGCGPFPVHPQHLKIMGNEKEWTFVDLYTKDTRIKNWDATVLDMVKDGTIEKIYASHLLEHISHVALDSVISLWHRKLQSGGELIINVPDLGWVCRQIGKYSEGQMLSGYFDQFEGEHGLLSVLYGSHSNEGEYHKSGFIESSLRNLLGRNGFKNINIEKIVEAHAMGCLIARCQK